MSWSDPEFCDCGSKNDPIYENIILPDGTRSILQNVICPDCRKHRQFEFFTYNSPLGVMDDA